MEKRKAPLIEIFFWEVFRIVRPFLGPDNICIFTPYTCSLYAADQLRTKSLLRALLAISWRLLSCNPVNGYLRWKWLSRVQEK
ncbi:MAG: hypothetical protein QG604_968 [Candidatus Dependentiae bacterium]|nr:hypothetical protein [Candidatus Dependentiae bacterium]